MLSEVKVVWLRFLFGFMLWGSVKAGLEVVLLDMLWGVWCTFFFLLRGFHCDDFPIDTWEGFLGLEVVLAILYGDESTAFEAVGVGVAEKFQVDQFDADVCECSLDLSCLDLGVD